MGTVLAVVGVVVVAGAIGGFLFVRSRRPAKDETEYHFNCPGCGRRLRYRAQQAGHAGKCPRCGNNLTFPRTPSGR